MSLLLNMSLWREFSNIFYKYKCRNGLYDPSHKDRYSFDKKGERYFLCEQGEYVRLDIRNNKTGKCFIKVILPLELMKEYIINRMEESK